MTNQTIILAAGQGKRMGGGDTPKVLVMLNQKPLILYLLHELEKTALLAKPVVVVGFMAEKVRGILGEDYLYAYQQKQLGTAHAVLAAKNQVKAENVLVLYGDMPFIKAESLARLEKLHRDTHSKISMFTAKPENFESPFSSLNHYGRIIRDREGKIEKIVEFKDASESQREQTEVNPGIYMFNSAWLWENLRKIQNHNAQGEYYLTDIAELAIKEGLKIESLAIDPKEVLGVNNSEDLKVAESVLV